MLVHLHDLIDVAVESLVRQIRESLDAGPVVELILAPLAEPPVARVKVRQDPRAARMQPVARPRLRMARDETRRDGLRRALVVRCVRRVCPRTDPPALMVSTCFCVGRRRREYNSRRTMSALAASSRSSAASSSEPRTMRAAGYRARTWSALSCVRTRSA